MMLHVASPAVIRQRRLVALAALVAVAIVARASIIAMGLPDWVLPVMLVVTVLVIVVLVGRSQGITRVTPLTPARRGE